MELNLEQRDPLTYAIIGAAIEVHCELGHGFLEPVYHEAFALELTSRAIPFAREVSLSLGYKGHVLQACYRCDFICYERIIVELKALKQLTGADDAQVLNYLKATGFDVGLLFNFGATSLQWKRLVMTPHDAARTKCDGPT